MLGARIIVGIVGLWLLLGGQTAWAHHVLGRPAYIWNEDSRTPPAILVETLIGRYSVNMMVYPAFPKAGEESRIKLYATHLESHQPFDGPIQFFVRDDRWFGDWFGDTRREALGTQLPTDTIYRQIVVFNEEADYIVTAEFTADGEPYTIEMPIRIGEHRQVWPLVLTVGVIGGVLGGAALKKRRRSRSAAA
ncbi:MAG: hypothetical protein HQL80_02875 [Magnetococcales bacterium]|nr:hypothetical protein [Magnetococcales bacterium]